MNEINNDSICTKMLAGLKRKIQYFGDESNLHGVGHVFSLSFIPFFKRLFWLIMLICCCFGASVILREALRVYSGDRVSYSVETNYLLWETPFPAVTICEMEDSVRTTAFVPKNDLPADPDSRTPKIINQLVTFFKEVSFWNIKYCKSCTTCKMNQTCLADFQQYIYKLRLNCTDLLTDCWWDNKPFPCCERFHPVDTEYGICFSFNSALVNASVLSVSREAGLPHLVMTAIQPILFKVHPATDRVSISMDNVLSGLNNIPLVTDFVATLNAVQTISDISVKSLSLSQRDCLFRDEHPAFAEYWPFPEYTYSACLLYCRALKQIQVCNCTHSFMPKLGNISVCGVEGLGCFYKNRDRLLTVNCDCPMACEEILYKLVHLVNYRHPDKVPEEITKRGSRIRVQILQLPSLRIRRHSIRDMLGLVVDVGGVGGVFFGASLLSVIEIVYLLCIRRGH